MDEFIKLAFNLTDRCNLRCQYCAVNGGDLKKGREQDNSKISSSVIVDAYKKIREKHPKACLDLYCTAYGEPLLNGDGISIIDQIHKDDSNTRKWVVSNGTLQDKILEMAQKEWIITISYDGIHHDDLRSQKEKVEDTIQKLSKITDRYFIRVAISPEFSKDIELSMDCIKELGGKYVIIGPIFPLGRYENKRTSLDIKDFYKGIKYASDIGLKPILSMQEPCTLALRGYFIMPNGDMSICCIKQIEPSPENRKRAKKERCLLIPFELKNYLTS